MVLLIKLLSFVIKFICSVKYLKLSFVDLTRARGQVQVFADHCAWTLIDGKAGGQKRGKKEDTDPHTASDFELRSLTSKSSDKLSQVKMGEAY